MRRMYVSALLILLASIAFVGCADPTRDKPKAVVEEKTAPAPDPPAEAETLVLAEGTTIGFVGSKVTGSHEGGFNSFEGEIRLVDDDPLRSSVSVTIDTTSLWADNEKLTGHLKSADFFDVEQFPTATFESTEITRDEDHYRITGNLNLHGVTRKISFPAHITVEGDRVTAQAEFAILRFEFGITYPGRADDLIRDAVLIKLNLVGEPAT